MSNVTPLRPNKPEPLEVKGAHSSSPHHVTIEFNRELTLEEFKFFYETSQRTAFLMRGMNND